MKAFESSWTDPYDSMEELDEKKGCCGNSSFWWKEPPQDNIVISYLRENSMHGLKYVAEPRRHLSERICWILAFLIGVGAAAYLINSVWDNYRQKPVIVSFQPTDTVIGNIPFPAVTICNMNRFPKRVVDKWISEAQNDDSKLEAVLKDIVYLKSVCLAQLSFAQLFNFAGHRGFTLLNEERSEQEVKDDEAPLSDLDSGKHINSMLMEETMGCDQLVRLCRWSQENRNCSEIFRPIVTEFGKCCTFNILPVPLLLSNLTVTRYDDSNGAESSRSPNKKLRPRWNSTEISKWMKWDYNEGFILDSSFERPERQTRAGLPYGLSILVDPNVEEYFCPSTDSQGIRLVLHNPLEMPPIQNLGVPLGVGKEIFMDVYPRMTIADAAVEGFPHEKRGCYFQKEKNLKFFKPYTTSNCMEECIAELTANTCNCTLFYMPRRKGIKVCSSDKNTKEYKCYNNAQEKLTKDYRQTCPNCDSLCTDISYHFETTQATLQSSKILWNDPVPGKEVPEWANHSMSIIHIYFGSDSFVPQVRGELYATVDLIANTGGLLGLCLGFSVLSAVEIVYFFTLRWCCRRVRKKSVGEKISNRFVNAVDKVRIGQRMGIFKSGTQKRTGFPLVNNLRRDDGDERNILPVYPAYSYSDQGMAQRRAFQPERRY